MTFEDRISQREPLPDLAPLRAHYAWLCAQLLAAIVHPEVTLSLARQLRRHVRVMIQASQAHFRRRQKIAMLLRPDWRERVISELGGWKRLRRWTKRQAAIDAAPPEKTYHTIFHPAADEEEAARRAHMRELMKANAHPLILRDPCRMDFDGWFRLPPQARLVNPIADPDYDYDFDPRPMADFTGLKTPITVWPEEFRAAAEIRPLEEESEEAVPPDVVEPAAPKDCKVRRHIFFHEVPREAPPSAQEPIFLEKQTLFFFVRAPPRIRGSPNPARRQECLLAARLGMGVTNSALNKYG
ncbi:hypothetical protein [Litorimonas sp.]|uniref:hypothetical protein n=1 Tax=Litorimonas sp. TaxID=1892381 RepID=UPI003A83CC84